MNETLKNSWGPAAAPAPSNERVANGPEPVGIATAEELRRRIEARAKPTPSLSLSPPGVDGLQARRQAENLNEQRIAYLRGRLGGAHDRLHAGQSQMQMADQKKTEFERSRG